MYLTFNAKVKPFDDPRVRVAIAHAIRREDIIKAAFFGRGAPIEGLPLTEGTAFYDAKLAHGWPYDPAKAKALLAAAGVGNGFACKLLSTAQYGMHKDTATVVQQNLAAVGIQAELVLPDWSTRVTLGNRGQYELAVMGSASEYNDPDGLAPFLAGQPGAVLCAQLRARHSEDRRTARGRQERVRRYEASCNLHRAATGVPGTGADGRPVFPCARLRDEQGSERLPQSSRRADILLWHDDRGDQHRLRRELPSPDERPGSTKIRNVYE